MLSNKLDLNQETRFTIEAIKICNIGPDLKVEAVKIYKIGPGFEIIAATRKDF